MIGGTYGESALCVTGARKPPKLKVGKIIVSRNLQVPPNSLLSHPIDMSSYTTSSSSLLKHHKELSHDLGPTKPQNVRALGARIDSCDLVTGPNIATLGEQAC